MCIRLAQAMNTIIGCWCDVPHVVQFGAGGVLDGVYEHD